MGDGELGFDRLHRHVDVAAGRLAGFQGVDQVADGVDRRRLALRVDLARGDVVRVGAEAVADFEREAVIQRVGRAFAAQHVHVQKPAVRDEVAHGPVGVAHLEVPHVRVRDLESR